VTGHRTSRHRFEGRATLLADFALVVVGHAHEEVLAKQAAEHVAVDEAGQVAEHRTGRHRRVWRHQLLKRRFRLLTGLGHRHWAEGRHHWLTTSSAVMNARTEPPTSIRLGTSASVG